MSIAEWRLTFTLRGVVVRCSGWVLVPERSLECRIFKNYCLIQQLVIGHKPCPT